MGRGGFLGSWVERTLPAELPQATIWRPPEPGFSWLEPARLGDQLDRAVEAFRAEVAARSVGWIVFWCAGAGGVGTPADRLRGETDALRRLLAGLARLQTRGAVPRGQLVLSSSAGGVYGSNRDLPLTERSACRPISEYGRNKLEQEQAVQAWARATPEVSALLARITNLYGPGQAPTRPHGLVARLSQSLLHRRSLNVYVPLDTLRDYVHVALAAQCLVRCAHRLQQEARPACVVKVVAAEHSVSVAAIIGALARVAKRAPRIVCIPQLASRQQPERLCFRSETWADLTPEFRDLVTGIHEVYEEHLGLMKAGRLPPPAVV